MTELMERQGFYLDVDGEQCFAAPLYTEAQIDEGIGMMGERLAREYAAKGISSIVMVPILQGGKDYAIDLRNALRSAGGPTVFMDGMRFESMDGTESTGESRLRNDMSTDARGRHLLVVDDIFDTGLTLSDVHTRLTARNPASLRITTLIDKPNEKRIPGVEERVGGVASVFTMERPYFVIGRGLDYRGTYRDLKWIAKVLSPAQIDEQGL